MIDSQRFVTSLLTAAALSFTLIGCAYTTKPPTQADGFRLHIAHINDTHSAFDPVPGHFYLTASSASQRIYNEWGGHPRLLTQIDNHRQTAAGSTTPFLVLHGGDAWQGSAYFKLNEGRMNADILSRMGIDAMALGNHEFDLSNAHLNEFIETVNFPLLAANIDASADPDLRHQQNLQPYTLFAFNGDVKHPITLAEIPDHPSVVAVFGLVLDDMPSISPNTGEIRFLNMISTAQAMVDTLQNAGVKKIIALTHIGNAEDKRVAASVNGIDAIVGGHSHTLLGDFRHVGLADNGPYAEQVTTPNGGVTCIVQAGDYAQAVGLLTLEFDADGQLTLCRGENTLLSNDQFFSDSQRTAASAALTDSVKQFINRQSGIDIVGEDPALRARIDTHYRPAMEAAYGEVIAQVEVALTHIRRPGDDNSDQHGSRVAALVAEAHYSYAARPDIVALTGLKPDIALLGAGGIRTDIAAGQLREGDISLEMLPFASPLSVVPLRGSVIRELLHSVITDTLPAGSHAGRYPYGARLRYTFEETTPGQEGELTLLEVNTGSMEKPRWRPVQDEVLYTVVVNSYLANGNDGWTALFEAQESSTGRIDIILRDGRPIIYPVKNLQRRGDRVSVVYSEDTPDCSSDNLQCNTDAAAVIEFIRNQSEPLEALPYPQVTLLR